MSNNIRILNLDPQEITINGTGTPTGITNVYVNGVDVTVGTKAYVIVPTKLSELTNDEGFITNAEETDPTVPYYVKEITMADITTWNDKQDGLVSGVNIKTINNNSLLGSGDIQITATDYVAGDGIDITGNVISNTITSYNDLTDQPTIPTRTSQLINDSGFITNQVDDLEYYIPASILEDVLPKVSDSGDDLFLEDSAPYKLKIELNPSEIEQYTTTGANLFNVPLELGTFDSDTGDKQASGTNYRTADKIALLPSTTYTLSINGVSQKYVLYYYDTDENFISVGTLATGTFTTPNNCYYINFRCFNADFTNDYESLKIQLQTGSSATAYEEYTGGMASPNPLYPQDLHVISGENSITISNRNLIDPYSSYIGTSKGIATTYNTDQSLSFSGTSEATWAYLTNVNSTNKIDLNAPSGNYTFSINKASSVYTTIIRLFYDNNNYQDITINKNTTSRTATVSHDTVAYQLYISGFTIGTEINETLHFQLEKGSTATTYVSHQETVYPIDLSDVYNEDTGTTENLELTKIGDYETFFFKNYKDSKYYNPYAPENTIYYNMGVYKYICNPLDDWSFIEGDNNEGYIAYVNLNNLWAGATSTFKLYSNYFLDYTKKDPNNYTCASAWNNTLYINLI